MKHNYPSDQILLYIYGELPALEHLETEYAIAHDKVWHDAFTKLKSAVSALPKIYFFPKHSVVRSIQAYSASTS